MKRVLIIIGSPKTCKSNSYEISQYIKEQLQNKNFKFSTVTVSELIVSKIKMSSTINDLYDYDNIMLFSPLYVDSLPSGVIEVLEKFSKQRIERGCVPYFSAIINCGFPEGEQTENALRTCKSFSDYMGFKWQRGVGIGMGETIGGQKISTLGSSHGQVTTELLMLCADLANEKQAFEPCFAAPYIPRKLFIKVGALHWYKKAFKNKCLFKVNNKPYVGNNITS